VADFRRNGWPDCVGISGRLGSDYALRHTKAFLGAWGSENSAHGRQRQGEAADTDRRQHNSWRTKSVEHANRQRSRRSPQTRSESRRDLYPLPPIEQCATAGLARDQNQLSPHGQTNTATDASDRQAWRKARSRMSRVLASTGLVSAKRPPRLTPIALATP